ncbi:MAG: ABC transporter ATP-binding protein [Acidimicrobiales bacterium]
MNAITVDHVSKKFRWHRDRRQSLKERVFRGKPDDANLNEFWALKDISLDVPTGKTFGLVGHNGCGKSTLLKLMTGIHRPTMGAIETRGRVSALLELGAGFHPELTGRENIYLNAAILGFSRRQIDSQVERIIDFSGIGDFVDVPVKVYSSGMYVRLGFSIAVTVEPEILIIDEIVAVGDEEFQRKCFDHLHELKRRGTTIVIVTHSLALVENLCDAAAWLDHGQLRSLGEGRAVVREYLEAVNVEEAMHSGDADSTEDGRTLEGRVRLGTGEIQVVDVEFLDAAGVASPVLLSGEPATFRLHYLAKQHVDAAIFGLAFVHESGVRLSAPSSLTERVYLPVAPGEGYVDFSVPCLTFQPGSFAVSTGVVEGGHTYDYHQDAYDLKVRGAGTGEQGLVSLLGQWSAPGHNDSPPNSTRRGGSRAARLKAGAARSTGQT